MDDQQDFQPRQVLTIREAAPFREFFEVRKGTLRFERFDGTMSGDVGRQSYPKWDAAGILG